MKLILWSGSTANLVVGLTLVFAYRSVFKRFGWEQPTLPLSVQTAGILIALIGVALVVVARQPHRNRSLLWLACAAQASYAAITAYNVVTAELSFAFSLVAIVQALYLLLFWWVDRRLGASSCVRHPAAVANAIAA
jgi:drug/metabolite transporter (DMT)-like permease